MRKWFQLAVSANIHDLSLPIVCQNSVHEMQTVCSKETEHVKENTTWANVMNLTEQNIISVCLVKMIIIPIYFALLGGH